MQKNPSNPPEPGAVTNDQGIAAELETLRRELLGHKRRTHNNTNAEEDLVVFRFVHGMPQAQWTALTSRPELAGWIAMPLHEDAYSALRRMQQTLDSLTHAVGHDDLTGLARRDIFERSLIAEMERARRTKSSVSLAILDIDDFKRINDTYGHVHGDTVLRAFSAILRDGVRTTDLCARFGGEEFALIMPATPMVKAVQLLERLMAAVRNLNSGSVNCPGPNSSIGVTCSIGLACYKGLGNLHPTEFMEMADKALYLAKKKGKSRIETAPFRDIAPALSDQTLVDSNEKAFLYDTQSNG